MLIINPPHSQATTAHLATRSPNGAPVQSPTNRLSPAPSLINLDRLDLWAQSGLAEGKLSSLALIGTIPPSTLLGLAQSHISQRTLPATTSDGSISPQALAHVLILTPSQAALHHQIRSEASCSLLNRDNLESQLVSLLQQIEIW